MVDEIIIHDVDVSSCKYLPYCEDKQGNCGNNPDCYFKQLARKTAECKKYEQAFDSIVATIKDLENENIVTFPDFSLKENCQMIMGQCNKGYVDILHIITKAKDGE